MKKPHRRHPTIFSNLIRTLSFLSVTAIMTPEQSFYYVHPQQAVSEAERILLEKKFSGAPLKEKRMHRYVRLDALTRNLGICEKCEQVAEEIKLAKSIPENTTIEKLIELLALTNDSAPVFVIDGNSIVGLVTPADLDKIPVKVYFFTLISALESLLLDIIGKDYQRYKLLLDSPGKVENRCRRRSGENVGLEEYNYLMTPEILEIVSKSEIREQMEITDDSELEELKNFRNDIAHGNYVIIKDSDVKRLLQRRDQICKYLRTLAQTRIERLPSPSCTVARVC